MPRQLVLLDLEAGRSFVDALQAAWEAGDAVAPLDRRLPPVRRDEVISALRPGAVVDASGERHTLAGGIPVEDGDALVVATSGTTGSSRGVILTHEALRCSALATSERLGVDPGRDRWLACIPLAHIGGLAVVTRSLLTGTPLVVHPRFDPQRTEAAAKEGATLVSLVARALHRVNPSLFRAILLGGSAYAGAVPDNVVITYGMTETGSGVVYDGVPLDGVEVRVADGGEILLRGPMLLRAYRDMSGDGTERSRVAFRPDGWFATGDAGRLLADGRLEVDGRIADVIVTGGEKVWPTAVEGVLSAHPGIAEVAVVGRPDPDWGERVVAWIVPRRESSRSAPVTLDELRDLVAERIAPWARPSELVVVDALPRTASGKIRRTALR